MSTRNPIFALTLSIGLAAGFAQSALAGKAVVTSAEGDESVFEYQRNKLRINTVEDSNYAVIRDGGFYTVMQDNGRTMVIDAGSMMQAFGGMAQGANPGDLAVKVISLKKTRGTETIAGIKGDVYELKFEGESGDMQTEEIVLSDDRRVRELRDALFLMLETITKNTSMGDPENARDMLDRLEDLDSGVLRFGQDLLITSISGDRIDDARFELPAEPMNLQGLGDMLGGMNQQGSDQSGPANSAGDAAGSGEAGVFSSIMGALGSKAERQSDRVGGSVENEIDEETDAKVDNAIDKAFGKLFGR
ncbi:MAG: hypothetical protein AB8B57_12995 [Congregibacter sp.]